MLKGTLPVLIGAKYGVETAMLAGLGAFIGHLFPVWLRFQGRQGGGHLYRRVDWPLLALRPVILWYLADRRRDL